VLICSWCFHFLVYAVRRRNIVHILNVVFIALIGLYWLKHSVVLLKTLALARRTCSFVQIYKSRKHMETLHGCVILLLLKFASCYLFSDGVVRCQILEYCNIESCLPNCCRRRLLLARAQWNTRWLGVFSVFWEVFDIKAVVDRRVSQVYAVTCRLSYSCVLLKRLSIACVRNAEDAKERKRGFQVRWLIVPLA